MKEKMIDQELLANAQELVSSLDRSTPVGLDVGALIPGLRLLEAGLPGCDRWAVSLGSTGLTLVLSRRVADGSQVLNAHVRMTWEQLRLFVTGADPFFRQAIANALAGLEQKEQEGTGERSGS